MEQFMEKWIQGEELAQDFDPLKGYIYSDAADKTERVKTHIQKWDDNKIKLVFARSMKLFTHQNTGAAIELMDLFLGNDELQKQALISLRKGLGMAYIFGDSADALKLKIIAEFIKMGRGPEAKIMLQKVSVSHSGYRKLQENWRPDGSFDPLRPTRIKIVHTLAKMLCGAKETMSQEKVKSILSVLSHRPWETALEGYIYGDATDKIEKIEEFIQTLSEGSIKELLASSMILFAQQQKVATAMDLMDLFLGDDRLQKAALMSLGEGVGASPLHSEDLNEIKAEIAAKLIQMKRFAEAPAVIQLIPTTHSRWSELRSHVSVDAFLIHPVHPYAKPLNWPAATRQKV